MPTTTRVPQFGWMATSVVALAFGLMLCANAFAQHGGASQNAAPRVVPSEDMRFWSFGDCERRYPHVATPEHKECVRIVGSPDAVEARALRICDMSHAADKDEAERCKANYSANKARATADGVVANVPAALQAPPSEEVMRRVRAITTAAVEDQAVAKPAAPKANDPAVLAVPPERSTWRGTLMTVVLLTVGVGLGVTVIRRKQAPSA